ncbi:hypothetical protein TWF694_005306 [Orbilia ellipsospora]|uniref:C2H2-type domain-containing protein n=1 Tax=Orbilia ellipsospora TaxID=2528407 RepID=A0AAV9WSQ4_9PEZI
MDNLRQHVKQLHGSEYLDQIRAGTDRTLDVASNPFPQHKESEIETEFDTDDWFERQFEHKSQIQFELASYPTSSEARRDGAVDTGSDFTIKDQLSKLQSDSKSGEYQNLTGKRDSYEHIKSGLPGNLEPLDPGWYKCDRCPETFHRKSDFKKHVERHTRPAFDRSNFDTEYNWRDHEAFLQSSKEALNKLKAASLETLRSEPFRGFVAEIGDNDNVIHTGCETLIEFLDKKIPRALSNLYCMLHVCYAISKSGSRESQPMTEEEFAKSVVEWKNCLPIVSDSGVRERDLFDEIRMVMWNEIAQGLEFVNDLLEQVANEHGSSFSHPIEDWESILDPKFFEDFGDIDPGVNQSSYGSLEGDPGTGDTSSIYSFSLPAWNVLVLNAIAVMAQEFFNRFREIGVVLLCTCGLVFNWLVHSGEATNTTPSPAPKLDISQREEVLQSAQEALNREIYPESAKILGLSSHPFLTGAIDNIYQLEKFMIYSLKSFNISSTAFDYFVSAIICHFHYYYHSKLPQAFKHASDVHRSPSYMIRRITEETRSPGESTLSELDNTDSSSSRPNPKPIRSNKTITPATSKFKRKASHQLDADGERSRYDLEAAPTGTSELRIIPWVLGGTKRRKRGNYR